ncbi:phasin family protein [Heliobacterium chlorum]|uniref:Phasin family protein n=1 Tax=Heliobacterium chlorum TaxID=2698 RepID=A0ABR7T6J0_HELCL|nr:phasin family protein [Heliobacterium chlorum]MBC9785575.1 phasin family protein [Heliobacterium chlorum]
MLDVVRKALLAGLGALTLTKERAESLVDELVKKGEMSKEDASKIVSELLEKSKEQREVVSDTIKTEFHRIRNDFGFVTRKEYEALEARIVKIEEKLGISTPPEVVIDADLSPKEDKESESGQP